ncbi:MAG: MucB/RseB C-terminal domain-containing protein [Cytophaga sp.]|nr:MucB/RseB C-terminal domain-containing protein [Undibacterium sp.]
MMNIKHYRLLALAIYSSYAMNNVAAQGVQSTATVSSSVETTESRNMADWLMRMHAASKKRAYIGTYVVSSGGTLSSAKIWHVCEDQQQIERVETLTGARKSIFRHNDRVVTFMPDQKVVRTEMRQSSSLFSELPQTTDHHIADFYKIKPEGVDRVAGMDADVVALLPKDGLRFGYRVWTVQKKGIVVKLQILDTDGKVMEQSAFSELQVDAPVKMKKLVGMMGKVAGYRMEEHPVLLKTTASAEGWNMKTSVAGFQPISCYKRPANGTTSLSSRESLQCIFSDGLASVSVFIENYVRLQHDNGLSISMGATNTATRQVANHWVTVVGEVPPSTLQLFVNRLEHKH